MNPTPRQRDVALEQVRIVGLGLRPEALVALVVLGGMTLLLAARILGGATAGRFDSDSPFGTSVVAFLFPFAVWKREQRFGPAFLWTLPVERRRLALMKVLAGWGWLMAALAAFVGWHLAMTLLVDARTVGSVAVSWLVRFPGATAMYLLGSALILGLRFPLRLLLGAVGGLLLLSTLGDLDPWMSLPDPARSLTGNVLWIAAGLAAVWAASLRHREHR